MKIRILISIALIGILTSCGKDWLQPEPLSIYTPNNVFVDKAGMESALVSLRKYLRNNFYGGAAGYALNGPTLYMYEYLSSEYGVAGETASGMAQNFDLGVTPTGQAGFFYNWYATWGAVRDANTIISRINDAKWKSENEKNIVLAEAYFHRAYWYYLVVHQYGDVPFINKEHTAPTTDLYTHSRKTILKKIQADLEFAVQNLPESVDPGKVCKAAGLHLLTKVYLANQEFDKAISTATAIINDGKHALMTKRFGSVGNNTRFNVIWDLHRPENKSLSTNTEGILVCQDKYGYPGAQTTNGAYTMRLFTPWWSYSSYLKDPNGLRACLDNPNDPELLALGRGVGMFRPGNYINFDVWKKMDKDLRHDPDTNWMPTRKIYVNNPASKFYKKPVEFKYSNPIDSIRAWYPWPYYKIYIPDQLVKDRPAGGNSDWYIFRLAETYLLRAEAYCWEGKFSLAAADINKIRERANAPAINVANVTIDEVLDERARELYLEELRKVELTRIAFIMAERGERGYSMNNFSEKNYWYDRVINNGKFYNRGIVWQAYEYKVSPFHVLWPIPQSAIDANSTGHINQNKGYFGAENNIEPLSEITDIQ